MKTREDKIKIISMLPRNFNLDGKREIYNFLKNEKSLINTKETNNGAMVIIDDLSDDQLDEILKIIKKYPQKNECGVIS